MKSSDIKIYFTAICGSTLLASCASQEFNEKMAAWDHLQKTQECRLYQDAFEVPGSNRTTKPLFICKDGKVYERPF